jgi:hypothetical protein
MLPGSSTLRVWLPSRRFKPFPPTEALFQLPTLLGFALQGFVPISRRVKGFPNTFRPYAFLSNPPA